jgi:hypothetical protein
VGGAAQCVPRSQWQIHPNHHAPIVSRDMYDEVQNRTHTTLLACAARKSPENVRLQHILLPHVCCGACGKALRLRQTRLPYYECENRYVTGSNNCVKRMDAFVLQEICFAVLHLECEKKCDSARWNNLRDMQRNLVNRSVEQKSFQQKQEHKRLQQDMRISYEAYNRNPNDASLARIKQQHQEMLVTRQQPWEHILPTEALHREHDINAWHDALCRTCIEKILVWTDFRIELRMVFRE